MKEFLETYSLVEKERKLNRYHPWWSIYAMIRKVNPNNMTDEMITFLSECYNISNDKLIGIIEESKIIKIYKDKNKSIQAEYEFYKEYPFGVDPYRFKYLVTY